MRILVSLALLAAFLDAQAPKVLPPSGEQTPGFQSITAEDCKAWLTKLASDECEGRATGTAGFQKAADIVAAHFREIGLKAVGDPDASGAPTYFQNVPFVAAGLDPESALFEIAGGPSPMSIKVGEGFGAGGLSDLDVDAPLAFALVDAARGKATGPDLAGKVVIALTYDNDGEVVSAQGGVVADLRKLGAAAVIRINDVSAARGMAVGEPHRKDRFQPSTGKASSVYVSKSVAQAIAAADGRDLSAMIAKAKAAGESQAIATKLTAKVRLVNKTTEIPVPNVVGYLEGSDPVLKSELVIIGSHLDHLGRSRDGTINNGADDDGSGSTGVLAISRALTKNGRAPKRSVLFLAFCGEEMGLLGSDWYVEHPIFPNENVMAELQMDMIGRREEALEGENPGNETADDNVNTLHLVGSKKIAPLLHDIILKTNGDHLGFAFEYDQEGVYTRSDHYHFARKGIPIAFFFTGFHADYHKPTDDVEKIDFPKLARVAQLVYLVAWELAERPERLPIEKPPRRRDGR